MPSIISDTSLTQDDIRNDILEFISTDSDASNWYPFFRDHASGRIFVDIISGVASLFLTHIISAKRESSIKEAALRTSIIAKAENTGYSVFRGTNTRYTMTFTPNVTKTVTKFEIVGQISDFDLISLEEKSIQSGISTTLLCTIGSVLINSLTIDTIDLKTFRFNNDDVSQDLRLFKNNGITVQEITDYSSILSDLINDKYVILSNHIGGVDIIYNNIEGTNPYTIGDVLTIIYISILSEKTFTVDEINFLLGDLDRFVITQRLIAPESNDAIRINAPLFSETQRVVQGRFDFRKRFKNLISDFDDTNQTDDVNELDPNAGLVFITYVRSDESFLTTTQKTSLINALSLNRPMGIIPPTIVDPEKKIMDLGISIKRNLSSNFIGVIEDEIINILSNYRHKLGIVIDLDSIERDINDITDSRGVSYAKSNNIVISNAISPILNWNEYFVFNFSLTLI